MFWAHSMPQGLHSFQGGFRSGCGTTIAPLNCLYRDSYKPRIGSLSWASKSMGALRVIRPSWSVARQCENTYAKTRMSYPVKAGNFENQPVFALTLQIFYYPRSLKNYFRRRFFLPYRWSRKHTINIIK